jgi:hypothetical protein
MNRATTACRIRAACRCSAALTLGGTRRGPDRLPPAPWISVTAMLIRYPRPKNLETDCGTRASGD